MAIINACEENMKKNLHFNLVIPKKRATFAPQFRKGMAG